MFLMCVYCMIRGASGCSIYQSQKHSKLPAVQVYCFTSVVGLFLLLLNNQKLIKTAQFGSKLDRSAWKRNGFLSLCLALRLVITSATRERQRLLGVTSSKSGLKVPDHAFQRILFKRVGPFKKFLLHPRGMLDAQGHMMRIVTDTLQGKEL